jgi:putative tryptophan/tyrosine transport system substrate-binding protein
MKCAIIGRRRFLLGAGALLVPARAFAQQAERVRRIAALMPTSESDSETPGLGAAFRRALQDFGWTSGKNLRVDYRWGGGDANRIAAYAAQIVADQPEVILAGGAPAVVPLKRATDSIPIVFIATSDPIAQGFVSNLAHPGGNITGFTNFAPTMGADWLRLLKEVAPAVNHVGVLYNPKTAPYTQSFISAAQAAAGPLAIKVSGAPVGDDAEIATTITAIGRAPGGGLLVPSDAFTYTHSLKIVGQAARNRLPAIYAFRVFAASGGLISYGVDLLQQTRQAAAYVDRILFGTSPGDLPVQPPSRLRLVINKKTATDLGLTLPPALLARADLVLE